MHLINNSIFQPFLNIFTINRMEGTLHRLNFLPINNCPMVAHPPERS